MYILTSLAFAANLAPMRSYVAAATYESERTTHLSILSSAQSLGFIIGPGLQAALIPIQCSDQVDQATYLAFDQYTAAG